MKVASGLFGIFAALLMVVGMFCGTGASCCAGMGTALDTSHRTVDRDAIAKNMGASVGASFGCLVFCVPFAALLSLVGGIAAFAKPRIGGVIQLGAFLFLAGGYFAAAVVGTRSGGAEGIAVSLMNGLLGGFAPGCLSLLGATTGLLAQRGSTHEKTTPQAP